MVYCRKAEKKDITRLVSFTDKLVKNEDLSLGFIQSGFIPKDIENTYVVCKYDIPVGMVVVERMDESDYEFYKDKSLLVNNTTSVYLSIMAVDIEYMGRGYGSILMEYVIKETKGSVLFCDIEISPNINKASLNFFKKLGFNNDSEFSYIHMNGIEKRYAFHSYNNISIYIK